MAGKIALVTGGNGITGSAIIEHLARNTTREQWSEIIVTSRSPFKVAVQDPRIRFVALDFGKDHETLADQMRELCAHVTHAYFSSYVHRDDFAKLNKANSALFENFLKALLKIAPGLENVTLQTGGKHYNVHLGPVPSPAREEEPRRKASIDNFYFPQEDALIAAQKGQKWTWNVIRPEAIIGHTSKPNGMNSALTFALFFIVSKELGGEAKMPTNQIYWAGYDDVSDSRLIADLSIFVSTHPRCGNEAFNVTNGDYFTWKYMWPRLAAYFGAKSTSDQEFTKPVPTIGQPQLDFSLAEWAKDKREVWDRICDRTGKPEAKATWDAGTWAFQDWVFQRTWSATLSINKARRFGWTGHIDSYKSFTDAFQSFEEIGLIPNTT
ncbi:NAD(P)-binding protein [Cadophora sp. DSE1049]|nr:NAD(P)-binding protein [Cadophora sp. DSE1049]